MAETERARQFQPLPGKAAIYVFYDESKTAYAGPLELYLSRGDSFQKTQLAEQWAQLPPKSFTRADVEPGQHGIVLFMIPTERSESAVVELKITVETNKTYFCEVIPDRGILDAFDSSAKQTIAGLQMVESYFGHMNQKILTTRMPRLSRPSEQIRVTSPDGTMRRYYLQEAWPKR